MQYIDEFYDNIRIQETLEAIAHKAKDLGEVRIMEFCGGHTHTFFQTGLIDLLPNNIKMIHGPGCPVCVLPAERIDSFIKLLQEDKTIIGCVYADLLKIPTYLGQSLLKAKGQGINVKTIYSPLQVLEIAKNNPGNEVVFFAIGFETTLPPTLAMIETAQKQNLSNLSVYGNHVKTSAALAHILQSSADRLEGIIAPGHVATVIGEELFKTAAQKYQIPMVISGFTPLDLSRSLVHLLTMISSKEYACLNDYKRAVRPKGNAVATALMKKMLVDRAEFTWRGLGTIANSAYQLSPDYRCFDAEERFVFKKSIGKENKACLCPQVLVGKNSPLDCKLYAKACTPLSPQGSCMVSSEGACSAYYRAGRGLPE